MDYFWAILALCALLIALWVMLVARVTRPMTDEDSTLDVANHIGDSRPVR